MLDGGMWDARGKRRKERAGQSSFSMGGSCALRTRDVITLGLRAPGDASTNTMQVQVDLQAIVSCGAGSLLMLLSRIYSFPCVSYTHADIRSYYIPHTDLGIEPGPSLSIAELTIV